MPYKITIDLFELSELTGEAHERALQNLATYVVGEMDFLSKVGFDMAEDWKEYLKTRCGFFDVEFSWKGFYSQGDGLSFTGSVSGIDSFLDMIQGLDSDAEGYGEMGFAAQGEDSSLNFGYVNAYPNLIKMLKIQLDNASDLAKEFNELTQVSFYPVLEITRSSHHYSHERSVSIEVNTDHCFCDPLIHSLNDKEQKLFDDAMKELLDLQEDAPKMFRDLMKAMYRKLEKAYEFTTSEEALKDMAEANGMLFYSYGTLSKYNSEGL